MRQKSRKFINEKNEAMNMQTSDRTNERMSEWISKFMDECMNE